MLPGFKEWKALAWKAFVENRMDDAEYYKKKAYECKDAPGVQPGSR